MKFGLIVIGDEILSGRRRDRHFEYFRGLLQERGFQLNWLQILPDDPELLVTIPEPCSLALFTLGSLGLLGFRRRRRKSFLPVDLPA